MPTDADLIQITEAVLADSYARAGDWMACKPGCHQCCIGVFPISTLDADRLRGALATADPAVAARIRQRASEARTRLTENFSGNAATGELFTEPHHEEAFDDFANDEPCPVLDPVTGTCDLYAARPIPCRTFGPPMPNNEGALAVCELCFVGAPESEVARCAVDADFLDAETEVVAEHESGTGVRGLTLIAFALAGERREAI
jgi:Fe-S-cluster containining protein